MGKDNKQEKSTRFDNDFFNKDFYSRDEVKLMLDIIPVGITVIDVMGNYMFKNKRYVKYINGEENTDTKLNELDNIYTVKNYSEENKRYLQSVSEHIISNKQPLENEEYIDINGTRRWFECYRTPILDNNKEVKYIVKVAKDITVEKNIENEITKGIALYQELLSTDSSYEFIPVDGILNILKNIVVRVGGSSGDIWLYDREFGELNPIWSEAKDVTMFLNSNFKVDYNVMLNYMDKKRSSNIIDIYEDECIIDKNLFIKQGFRHIAIFNLEFNSEAIGFITVYFTENLIPNFKKDNFLDNVCSQIATLIYNYNLVIKLGAEFNKRKELEKELNDFLETGVDLMVIVDDQGNFLKFNERWTSVLGWTEEELFAMKWHDIVYKDDLDDTLDEAYDENQKSNTKRRLRNRYITKDGRLKWLAWNYKFIEERNIFVGTARDITDEVELEKQRKIYEEALQLEAIKSEFFANISHEFKTPLNIILATVQLINTHMEYNRITVEEAIDLNKYIKSVKQNSYRLLRLVNNLIDLTKIDTGFYNINLGNYNIISIIEDISMSVAQYIENKAINLIFDTEVEELVIACDPDKIERIMLNLISNAIKYTKANGSIEINLSIIDGMLQVSVKDNGCGICSDKLEYIFERFIQVDNSLTRSHEGSGIGLSLVKSLVEMHGGDVWVYSEEGEGSDFNFTLPIKIIEEAVDTTKAKEVGMDKNNIEKCNIEFSDIYYL